MNILLLTDFSELSSYARFLADKCSKSLDAACHVLKVVDIPTEIHVNSDGELISGSAGDLTSLKIEKKEAHQKMIEWTKDMKSNIKTLVTFGHFQRTVYQYIESNSIDLVIMGTHGVSGIMEFLSGSMTERLIKENRVPVLSLKCDRSDVAFDHILLTGDFEGEFEFEIIKKVQNVFNSKIHLLSVLKSIDEEQNRLAKMEAFKSLNQLDNTVFHTVVANDTEQGVEDFMSNYEAENNVSFELLAVEKKDKSALGYLFTGCQATSLVNHVWRPILTYLKK